MISNTTSGWVRTAVVSLAAVALTYVCTQHSRDEASTRHASVPKLIQPVATNPLTSKSALDRSTAAGADANQQLVALNAKMVAMASELSGLQQQRTSVPSSREGAAALTAEEAQQQGDAQADAQATLIEQAVVGEKVDPSWAPAAENAIRRMFQDTQIESLQLVGAQCRATLCRIDIASNGSSPGAEDFDQSFRKLLVRMPWQGQGFGRVYDPFSSSPTAVFFLAREGQELPRPSS
jgi:hypothetical protein